MDYYPKSSFLFMVIPSTYKQGWFSAQQQIRQIFFHFALPCLLKLSLISVLIGPSIFMLDPRNSRWFCTSLKSSKNGDFSSVTTYIVVLLSLTWRAEEGGEEDEEATKHPHVVSWYNFMLEHFHCSSIISPELKRLLCGKLREPVSSAVYLAATR